MWPCTYLGIAVGSVVAKKITDHSCLIFTYTQYQVFPLLLHATIVWYSDPLRIQGTYMSWVILINSKFDNSTLVSVTHFDNSTLVSVTHGSCST